MKDVVLDLTLVRIFDLGSICKKYKNKQMEFHQAKKCLHSKGNSQQGDKATNNGEENLWEP
jgi:hypothetical protein